jgi:hypothetical protein
MQLSKRQRTALEQLRKSRNVELPSGRGIIVQAAVALGPAAMVGAAWIAISAALGYDTLAALMVGFGIGFVTAVMGYNRDQVRNWPLMMAIIDWEKVDSAITTNAIDESPVAG